MTNGSWWINTPAPSPLKWDDSKVCIPLSPQDFPAGLNLVAHRGNLLIMHVYGLPSLLCVTHLFPYWYCLASLLNKLLAHESLGHCLLLGEPK